MKGTTIAMLFSLSLVSAAATNAAIVMVQNVGTGSAPAGAPAVIAVPAAGVAAGDVVLLAVVTATPWPAPTVTDTRGNAYVVDAPQPATQMLLSVVRGTIASALTSSDFITVTSSPGVAMAASAFEFSGLAASPRDVSSGGTGTSAAPTTAATPATSQPNELLFGVVGAMGLPPAFLAGAGYAPLANATIPVGPLLLSVFPEYRTVSAAGSFVADGTLLPSSDWAALVVTYKDVVVPVTLQSLSAE